MRRFSTLLALTLLLCAGATAMQAFHIGSGNVGSLPNSRAGVVNARAVAPSNLAVPDAGVVMNGGDPSAGTFVMQSPGCSYALGWTGTRAEFGLAGGTSFVQVVATDGCAWEVVSNDPTWLTITDGATGTGDGVVSYQVAANNGPPRASTLTVAGQQFDVAQGIQGCNYGRQSPAPENFPPGGGHGMVTVLAESYCSWTATSLVPWITIRQGSMGTGTGGIVFEVAAHTGASRNGTIAIDGRSLFIINQSTAVPRNAKTVGVFRPANGVVYLKNTNAGGFDDLNFSYGVSGDTVLAGDWNGDGVDSLGVNRSRFFFLRNPNTTGEAERVFPFGLSNDLPVVGDWDGDGIDTIGIYRNGVFHLRNSNTTGAADLVFAFGAAGDLPIAGDWDGLP